ncbi:MAG: glycosyltransferase [Patulibacter sp.]|nr:glycosyltransferase [Patulibacter sp.]
MPLDLRPACVLLLPRPLSQFILRDQAEDLLRGDDVVAVDPPWGARGGYGTSLRLGDGPVGAAIARQQAGTLLKRLHAEARDPRVIVIFHATQEPVAAALCAKTGAELWYWRWDRYEAAGDADAERRKRLTELHRRASDRASLVVASSGALADLAETDGRSTVLSPLAADTFPAPDAAVEVVGFSLGHLGRRTDWALLRGLGERLPALQILFVGQLHADECANDPDFAWCRDHAPFVFLGKQPDAQAAQLLRLSDVGILPFRRDPFNDAGLPYRILKAARLGRRTVVPDLAGVRTWDPAIVVADDPEAFAAAVAAESGRRAAPDDKLREWALAQTAERQNAPLRERLRGLGLDAG